MISYFRQRSEKRKQIPFGDNIFIEHVADLVISTINYCTVIQINHTNVEIFFFHFYILSNKCEVCLRFLFWFLGFKDSLNSCIHQKLPHLLSSGSVKLVIVDSVAAVFRCDYELKDMYKRSKHMASLAASLHRMSSKYCLPIVCVNQVINNLGWKVL